RPRRRPRTRDRHRDAVLRIRQRTRVEALPLVGIRGAPRRPRVRVRGRSAMTTTRYELRRTQLESLLEELGEPGYRARQLYQGLYEQRRPLEALTNIPKPLLARLADELPLA